MHWTTFWTILQAPNNVRLALLLLFISISIRLHVLISLRSPLCAPVAVTAALRTVQYLPTAGTPHICTSQFVHQEECEHGLRCVRTVAEHSQQQHRKYTRSELLCALCIRPSPPTPELTPRLRDLGICSAKLSRKHTSRAGRRKQKKIQVVTSSSVRWRQNKSTSWCAAPPLSGLSTTRTECDVTHSSSPPAVSD